MHIKNSLFLFLKKPALFILFSSCFFIPQAFSGDWEDVSTYDLFADEYIKTRYYIWDHDEFPLRLCVDWSNFYQHEKKWIREGVKIWNNAFKDYRKRQEKEWEKDSTVSYFNTLRMIGIKEPLFKISCEDSHDPNVIQVQIRSLPGITAGRVEQGWKLFSWVYVNLYMDEREAEEIAFIMTFVHELGHVLGLGHYKKDALMYPNTDKCFKDLRKCLKPSDEIIQLFNDRYVEKYYNSNTNNLPVYPCSGWSAPSMKCLVP